MQINSIPSYPTINYRKLGNTGFDVSTIGFGMWQIGGGRWNTTSMEDRVYLLQKSLDIGINIYDAAVVYGQYKDSNAFLQSRSQELLGLAFQDRREQVYYCVKVGQYDELSHRSLFEPNRIVEQLQQSLKRLKTDYIDICLIHAPTLNDIKQEIAISVLKTVQALGFVRAVGYSFENEPEHILTAITQRIDVIMLQYNLLDQECMEAIRKSANYGVGILVGGPFKRGYLTGEFDNINDLPTTDHYWSWNIAKNKGKVEAILNRVNILKSQYGSAKNLRKVALSFILKENVASAIIGHRSVHEVYENILATQDPVEKDSQVERDSQVV